ncbi:sensor histidine kinase [Streptomyces smaragdinus]|nr:histidine kinase [Streptomyces smaragdinus]
MPYFMLVSAFVPLVWRGAEPFTDLGWQVAVFGMELPLIALSGLLFPLARPLEAGAARALCALPADVTLAVRAGRTWQERRRTAGWFTLHVGLGAVVSGITLAVPPLAVVLMVLPFAGSLREFVGIGHSVWLAPPAGLVLLLALVAVAVGAGALVARCAGPLLGPTPADRLAAARARADELARRNELARELHDSVGHALSAVSLQASAARRVLERDPDFVREALAAIEETTRDAVAELDAVLGVLREEATVPAPTAGLDALLARTRAAGAVVDARIGADLDALPEGVAREAYRIVQEGLGNVLRHGGACGDVTLNIARTEERLIITLTNPLGGSPSRSTGGRGLRGIAERARLLGGTAEAGPYGGDFRLRAELPCPT